MLVVATVAVALLALFVLKHRRWPASASDDAVGTASAVADETPDFESRLRDADATFYGADWCAFTRKQHEELAGVQYRYVDCGSDDAPCQDAGVQAYPTWRIRGRRHEGFMTRERLADLL